MQALLKIQFPSIQVVQMTLFQSKKQACPDDIHNCLQIIHSCGNHWIEASTKCCGMGEVNVYDSAYCTLDKETAKVLFNLFQKSPGCITVKMKSVQIQTMGMECGLFTIAVSTALKLPHPANLDPEKMRL